MGEPLDDELLLDDAFPLEELDDELLLDDAFPLEELDDELLLDDAFPLEELDDELLLDGTLRLREEPRLDEEPAVVGEPPPVPSWVTVVEGELPEPPDPPSPVAEGSAVPPQEAPAVRPRTPRNTAREGVRFMAISGGS